MEQRLISPVERLILFRPLPRSGHEERVEQDGQQRPEGLVERLISGQRLFRHERPGLRLAGRQKRESQRLRHLVP